MLLWLIFAVLSAGVLAALLRPLLAPAAAVADDGGSGVTAVYMDQLTEIDGEQTRGLLGAEEADAARLEISRRILASTAEANAAVGFPETADAAAPSQTPAARLPATRLAAALSVLVPLAAVALYLRAGDPGLPAQPYAHRQPPRPTINAEMSKLIVAVEARLKQNPDDGRGWDVIAPVYLRIDRNADAVTAYRRAIALNGETVGRLSGLAEAIMLANDGRVLPEARAALRKILKLEPQHVQAQFWLAHAEEQDGNMAAAAAAYASLLAKAPPDAAWRKPLEERLSAVRAALGRPVPKGVAPVEPGPTSVDVAAAESMSPADRQAMIETMVSGLAARLEKDGNNLAGWQRLIRSLTVLGRKTDALAALGRARKALQSEPQSLAALAELARDLGLGS